MWARLSDTGHTVDPAAKLPSSPLEDLPRTDPASPRGTDTGPSGPDVPGNAGIVLDSLRAQLEHGGFSVVLLSRAFNLPVPEMLRTLTHLRDQGLIEPLQGRPYLGITPAGEEFRSSGSVGTRRS